MSHDYIQGSESHNLMTCWLKNSVLLPVQMILTLSSGMCEIGKETLTSTDKINFSQDTLTECCWRAWVQQKPVILLMLLVIVRGSFPYRVWQWLIKHGCSWDPLWGVNISLRQVMLVSARALIVFSFWKVRLWVFLTFLLMPATHLDSFFFPLQRCLYKYGNGATLFTGCQWLTARPGSRSLSSLHRVDHTHTHTQNAGRSTNLPWDLFSKAIKESWILPAFMK